MKTKSFIQIAFLGILLTGGASAQGNIPCRLLKDVNAKGIVPGPSSTPKGLVTGYDYTNMTAGGRMIEMGGWLYFLAETSSTGVELYRTKGMPGTGELVKDINPGPGRGVSTGTSTGSLLFLAADDGIHGYELWASDGTEAGTRMIKDIRTGSLSGNPTTLIAFGDKVLFRADDGSGSGGGLWVSDGTSAGTFLVMGDVPGSSGSFDDPCALGSLVLFSSWTKALGFELYASDGTVAGTGLLMDINPGTGNGGPSYMTRLGNKVFFEAQAASLRAGLWESDGTAAGTKLVMEISPGVDRIGPMKLLLAGKYIYFWANDGTGKGHELWVTDGTLAGTRFVKDIYPGGSDSSLGSYFNGWTAFGDKVLFCANDGVTGNEPWVSDGTPAGTIRLADINPGNKSGNGIYWAALGPQNAPVKAVFQADDGVHGAELWETDGTPAGTRLLKDILPGGTGGLPACSTQMGNLVFFQGSDGIAGVELWCTDGTAANTRLFWDIHAGATNPSNPNHMVDVCGTVYFTANDGVNGEELWKTDGTAAGTAMVKDIQPGSGSGATQPLPGNYVMEYWRTSGGLLRPCALGKWFFFQGNDGVHGSEIWKTDGTAAGTVMVKDIYAGSSGAQFLYGAVMGGHVYFFARNESGQCLWRTDGSEAGTTLVKSGFTSPWRYPLVAGEKIYFYGSTAAEGGEPWVSDGTAAGTHLILDIVTGTSSGTFLDPAALSGLVFFMARLPDDSSTWRALWRTDGTAAGTYMLHKVDSASMQQMQQRIVFNNKVYFQGMGPAGAEIWVTDGTVAGTMPFADINFGPNSGYFMSPCVCGDSLFFCADDGVHGYELWQTDGTAAGTSLAMDLKPGLMSGAPGSMFNVGSRHFAFRANDGMGGNELWVSDGSSAGTRFVCDLNPAGGSQFDIRLDRGTLSRGHLLFPGADALTGQEPWILRRFDFQGTGGVVATCAEFGHSSGGGMGFGLAGIDPVLGSTLHLETRVWGPGRAGFLLFGLPTGDPIRLGRSVYLYIDLMPGVVYLPYTGLGTVSMTIPNDPTFIGTALAAQGFVAPGSTPFGIDFTNGLSLVFGR